MRRKPRATVTITAKLSPELAEAFYEVVNSDEFDGNVSAAMRAAIKLLIKHHKGTPLKATPQSM